MIGDKLMFGITDKTVRERLLQDTELILTGAVTVLQAGEFALHHATTFTEAERDTDTETNGTAVAMA